MSPQAPSTLQSLTLQAIQACSVEQKSLLIKELERRLDAGEVFSHDAPAQQIDHPGRPSSVILVDPRDVPRRKLSTETGRACFLHAVAHIEFNAINLALDAAYRFSGMPLQYYRDWVSVAADEARHHALVVDRVRELGSDYGDFPAHDGLWDIARRTAGSLMDRMAMVPCVLEARGLDVTPAMVDRLRQVNEHVGADILALILREEVGHVGIGVRWFFEACRERGLEPIDTYTGLYREYMPGRRQGPFNETDRRAAGFTDEWMAALRRLNESGSTSRTTEAPVCRA